VTTDQKVTTFDVRDMANAMPIGLLCILAHQSDREYLTPEEAKALLALFPDPKFEAVKKAVQGDAKLEERFRVSMLYRVRQARLMVNYTSPTQSVKVTGDDGWVWTLGKGNAVFQVPDDLREMVEERLRAP